ncbi:MAG: hypothetical protein IKS35_07135 [Clostridia bacterium]|nr:hypothetical protein [Clostridia bacterium]
MTYVISDPKGCLTVYRNLLKQIRFRDTDTMYVLGNLVGDGPDPIGLVTEMSMQSNVMPILGDDDYRAYTILSKMRTLLQEKQSPDKAFLREMAAWVSDGGQKTLDQFRELSDEMQEGILDYLEDMLLYAEINVKGADYLLIHKGVSDYTPDLDLDVCGPDDFLSESFDPKVEHDPNRVVIVGHIPVSEIPDAEANKIFYGPNLIALNCEVTQGGSLGCLCLDNGQEFYASEPDN